MDDTREIVRNIKKELRLYMNGVTSSQQRRLGMNYNIIFGVSIPHLKEIAAKFPKDATLAQTLWKENIRESKLLGIYLLPEEMYSTVADTWIGECRYHENADHLSHTILCNLPDAAIRALGWIAQDDALYKRCGYLTLAHVFRRGDALTEEQEERFFAHIAEILGNGTRHEEQAPAMSALDSYCYGDEERSARLAAAHPGCAVLL